MLLMRDGLELRRKYREMRAMRAAHEAGTEDPVAVRGQMMVLARRFPGALRELDGLELAEIDRRLSSLEQFIGGRLEAEPWMEPMACYHRLARGALAAKAWLARHGHGKHGRTRGIPETVDEVRGGARPVDPAAVPIDKALRAGFCAALDSDEVADEARFWADDLTSIGAPPRGRISVLVFERLATLLGLSPAQASELVLPNSSSRRARRGSRGSP